MHDITPMGKTFRMAKEPEPELGIDFILGLIDKLPIDKRAELLSKVIVSEPIIHIVIGSHSVNNTGEIFIQFNNTDKEALVNMIDALAYRVRGVPKGDDK